MSEVSLPARARVLGLAIDVVHQHTVWPDLCDALCDALGGTAFMAFEFDFGSFTSPIFHSSHSIKDATPLIAATMEGRVPDVEIAGYKRFSTFPAGRLVGEFECYDLEHDRDLPDNPYRDAVLAITGARSRTVMRLNDIGPWSDIAALHLPCPAAEMHEAIRTEAELLMPVVGRAIEAARTVNGLTRVNKALTVAFDQLDFGVAICEPSGRIIIANAEFCAMAADRDGVTDIGGVVGATRTSDRVALAEAIRTAPSPTTSTRMTICRLGRRSGRLPLIARAVPIRGSEMGMGLGSFTLLLVVDPEANDRVNADGIDALGVLSQAELDVCQMIVRGQATSEIAAVRGTTIQTATDQIKSALSKLACTSRLDIVRLAMATKPPGRP